MSNLSDFTREERAEWLDNEITQIVLDNLKERLEWANAEGWKHGPEKHDFFKGKIETYQDIILLITTIKEGL
jgi:hypothetical protein